MDLYTTFVRLAGQDPPTDRVVDGIDLTTTLINNTLTDRWVGHAIFVGLTGMSSKWTLTGVQFLAFKAKSCPLLIHWTGISKVEAN